MFSTHSLSIGYLRKGETFAIQRDLNLQLNLGELVCLAGPNGSGKSTLLRTLSGLQPPLFGRVQIDGEDIFALSVRQKALQLAMVLTERVDIENTTVAQTVAMGRQPYTSWWGIIAKNDEKKINDALQLVHLQEFKNRFINELSDGERQRVMIARALAQDTPHIFLDEPTAHLDLPNRIEIMLLLRRLAHKTKKAILLSTHELDIALQVADCIWLLSSDLPVQIGSPAALIANGTFERVFDSINYSFNTNNEYFIKLKNLESV
ncbi:MAG: ABC transporter ATP-binding protein [Paludibacter sp.]|nr:ABC transporter ATP-binding protein [Paludibacter sp.]